MEELSELVERLHRAQERTTVDDVAETLGVTPEAVASTLRAMRSERVPPVAATTRNPRSPRGFRYVALASALFLIGGIAFSIGHESGISKGRRNALNGPSTSIAGRGTLESDLAEALRTALPAGFTLKVGDVAYTGAPGTVFAGEAALTPLIHALIMRESGMEAPVGARTKPSIDDVRRISLGDTTVGGVVDWKPIVVEAHGQEFTGHWPRQIRASEGSSALSNALDTARYRAATVAANRISEWAANPKP